MCLMPIQDILIQKVIVSFVLSLNKKKKDWKVFDNL